QVSSLLASFAGDPAMVGEDGRVRWGHDVHAPLLDGRSVDADGYFDAIEAGYRAMDACLRAHGPRPAAPDGPLRAVATAPVRHIHRDTWTYYRIARASLAPSLLADSIKREAFLERLFTLHPREELGRRAELAMVQSEVDALRELDIPLFQCRPGDGA